MIGPKSVSNPRHQEWLPDFCGLPFLLGSVIVLQLALFWALLVSGLSAGDYALLALYVLWVHLAALVLLCLLRRVLERLPVAAGWLAVIGVVTAVALAVAEGVQQLVLRPPDPAVASPQDWSLHLRTVGAAALAALAALGAHALYVQLRHMMRERAEARVEALQARIRPHFLFNTLNTVAELIPTAPAQAEQAIEDLCALLRAKLGGDGPVPAADELRLTEQYLAIERLRFGERLHVDWTVAEVPSGLLLPGLSLQPLVENALRHGIGQLPEGGWVRVADRREDSRWVLEVENPVAGSASPPGHGLAIDSIRHRLVALHGRGANLTTERFGDRFRARLSVPLGDAS